ncbi:cupin domain-containing protein [Nocardia terpenica]|uniref:Cupin type-2 domain-containing protein n=1 Tax=Nocardia terpenica TaxID=455432 RepID=A0A164MGH4_9NOCA|nr:cupin domain-containing protein [Nocardia terpenica]KZM73337.1 hypothetical protein AWN90_32280 [Nocardia terpenica]NQE87511.1 cupin domain-containing protein [Nocardia terpenica]
MTEQDVPFVVRRTDVRAINSVAIDGVRHELGEQRDFRRDERLSGFLPEDGRTSLAWVRLQDGQILGDHAHPTKSMIIICTGSVRLTGDTEQLVEAGDIVCVPAGRLHGFRTLTGQSFDGLSVQFEGNGLYENEAEARVTFQNSFDSPAMTSTRAALTELRAYSADRCRKHQQGQLFRLFASGKLQNDGNLRSRFFSALYTFSRCFQRMVLTRQALVIDDALRLEYAGHLAEELGHDELLSTGFGVRAPAYDPILEAASNWFVAQMYGRDEAEKIVIVHMVVEASGHVFGTAAQPIFETRAAEGSYFDVHAEADDGHACLGQEYLANLSEARLRELRAICEKAWDQMDLVHDRIAAYTLAE